MAAPTARFEITNQLHGDDCQGCAKAAHDAAVDARVTGSTGATCSVDRALLNGSRALHSATVRRVYGALITLGASA